MLLVLYVVFFIRRGCRRELILLCVVRLCVQGQQRERLQHQADREKQVRTLCLLGNETMHMMHYLTDDPVVRGPFLSTEMVDRLAQMLDYMLVELAGPNMMQLKVRLCSCFSLIHHNIMCVCERECSPSVVSPCSLSLSP